MRSFLAQRRLFFSFIYKNLALNDRLSLQRMNSKIKCLNKNTPKTHRWKNDFFYWEIISRLLNWKFTPYCLLWASASLSMEGKCGYLNREQMPLNSSDKSVWICQHAIVPMIRTTISTYRNRKLNCRRQSMGQARYFEMSWSRIDSWCYL